VKGRLLSRRYATALVDLAVAEDKVDRYQEEIEAIAGAMAGIEEVNEVLTVPLYPRDVREGVLDRLSAEYNISKIVKSFLRLLLEKRRIGHLPQIVESYKEIVDKRRGRLHARITSAQALDDQTAKKLAQLLSRRFGHEVLLKMEVDPDLIGGIRAQVGSVVIDGSVRGRLENLRASLNKG